MATTREQITAQRIKSTRIARGITQQAVSSACNVSLGMCGMWERGDHRPSTAAICALADVLGVSTDYLLGRVDAPSDESIEAAE